MLMLVRRVGFALGAAGILSAIFRMWGEGEVPQKTGGWKPVAADEFH